MAPQDDVGFYAHDTRFVSGYSVTINGLKPLLLDAITVEHFSARHEWLLGPYLDAHQRIHGDPTVVARVLAPFEAHFREAGIGTVSEIFEGEPPYRPAWAIAQAWSVGELLWHARRYTPR